MYRRSFVKLGVFSALMEELKKVPAFFSHKAREGAKTYVDSASKTLEFLKGEDPSESPEMREKRRKHKEIYLAILNEQAAKAAAEKTAEQQKRAQLSWKQRLSLNMQEAKEALQQMVSTKAGVMAVLQHCTASHAAEIALEQGIDVKNVQMVFEKAAAKNAVDHEDVVVGYIDAPAASREEVMAFAEKLHKACPVANSMHIEWRQGRPDAQGGDARRADDFQRNVERAEQQMEWTEGRSGGSGVSSPRTEAAEAAAPNIPRGMPGSHRYYQPFTVSASRNLHDDDDAFHLPGVKPSRDKAAATTDGTGASNATATESSKPSTSESAAAPKPSESANDATRPQP
jgi:hypothetical protein